MRELEPQRRLDEITDFTCLSAVSDLVGLTFVIKATLSKTTTTITKKLCFKSKKKQCNTIICYRALVDVFL